MRFKEFRLDEKLAAQLGTASGSSKTASDILKDLGFDAPSLPDLPDLPSNDQASNDDDDQGEGFNGKIFVVGDSIAVGIKDASNKDGIAVGGKNTKQVLEMISDLSERFDLKGSLVILSSGASNSTFERPGGESQPFDVSIVNSQLAKLRSAGAVTVLVGTGSKASQWFKNKYGTYRVNFEKENVNEKLAAAASANGAKFLGPLEQYAPGLNSGKGDGIHPFGAYKELFNAAVRLAGPIGGKKKVAGNISQGSSGPANVGAIQSYLSSKGLDKNQVAGIMANIKHESNFNAGAIGDNGTSGGLFQHHADRFTRMRQAAGSNWKSNWKGQIDFALSEPAGQQYKSLKFTSPEQATQWWTINFEIPANKYAQANIRSRSASQFA